MSREFNGSTQYGSKSSPTGLPTSFAVTIACFARPQTTPSGVIMSYGKQDEADKHYLAITSEPSSTQIKFASKRNDATASPHTVLGGTAYDVDAWHHVAGVFKSGTSTSIYVDGVVDGSDDVTSRSFPTTPDMLAVGTLFQSSSPSLFFDGLVAECAVWSVFLTANEIAALASGVPPTLVNTKNLKFYSPMWGNHSPEPDLGGGSNNLTLTASPTQQSHISTGKQVLYDNGWQYRHVKDNNPAVILDRLTPV